MLRGAQNPHRLAWLWFLLAGCLFLPTLDLSFFADDEIYLAFSNHQLRGMNWSGLYQLLLRPANPWEFLPVRDFSYWLDLQLFGDDGFGFHLSNFCIYLLSGVSAGWFVAELLDNEYRGKPRSDSYALPQFAAAFFLLHPAHVEAVAWISGRKDLLAGLFSIVMLALVVRALRLRYATVPLCLATCSFVLACFSKSTAVAMVFPVSALLVFGGLAHRFPARKLRLIVALVVFWAIALLATTAHLHFGSELGIRLENTPGPVASVERASRIITSLLRLLFLPVDLGLFHDVYIVSNWHWVVSVLTLLLLFAATAAMARCVRAWWPLATLLIISPMLPYLQVVPFSTWSMASERFVFVSVLGVALLLVDGLRRLPLPKIGSAIVPVLFVVLGVLSWQRIDDWHSPRTLLEHEYRRQPSHYITVRDYVNIVLLPQDSSKIAEVISGITRSDARELISLQTELTLLNRNAQRQGVNDKNMPGYCVGIYRLYAMHAAGQLKLRTEPDLAFSNLLRSVDRHLYYSLGDPKRRCGPPQEQQNE